jgi:hypothetical protein
MRKLVQIAMLVLSLLWSYTGSGPGGLEPPEPGFRALTYSDWCGLNRDLHALAQHHQEESEHDRLFPTHSYHLLSRIPLEPLVGRGTARKLHDIITGSESFQGCAYYAERVGILAQVIAEPKQGIPYFSRTQRPVVLSEDSLDRLANVDGKTLGIAQNIIPMLGSNAQCQSLNDLLQLHDANVQLVTLSHCLPQLFLSRFKRTFVIRKSHTLSPLQRIYTNVA